MSHSPPSTVLSAITGLYSFPALNATGKVDEVELARLIFNGPLFKRVNLHPDIAYPAPPDRRRGIARQAQAGVIYIKLAARSADGTEFYIRIPQLRGLAKCQVVYQSVIGPLGYRE